MTPTYIPLPPSLLLPPLLSLPQGPEAEEAMMATPRRVVTLEPTMAWASALVAAVVRWVWWWAVFLWGWWWEGWWCCRCGVCVCVRVVGGGGGVRWGVGDAYVMVMVAYKSNRRGERRTTAVVEAATAPMSAEGM